MHRRILCRRVAPAFALTILAGGFASAGPLTLNPDAYGNSPGEPARARLFAAPLAAPSPAPVRQAAAPGNMGGGLIEALFGGRSRSGPRYYEPAAPSAQSGLPSLFGNGPAQPAPVDAVQQEGRTYEMNPRYQRQEVRFDGKEGPGTIIINTNERLLYLVQDGGKAIRYGIGVGRPGFTWAGIKQISQKREWPDWTPPPEMIKRRPDLPRHMVGGPDNPLGARAMYLGSSLYRIHGSNEPWTIGTQVSSGCIRMRNEDVIDLYSRVKVGTKVVVI